MPHPPDFFRALVFYRPGMTSPPVPGTTGISTTSPAPNGSTPQPADGLDAVLAQGHEQVVFCHDAESGLRAVIALFSTALGPGLGGTRFRPYPGMAAAVADVLDLSQAMAYKNAPAGLDHGGGKAGIVGGPKRDKSEGVVPGHRGFVGALCGRL